MCAELVIFAKKFYKRRFMKFVLTFLCLLNGWIFASAQTHNLLYNNNLAYFCAIVKADTVPLPDSVKQLGGRAVPDTLVVADTLPVQVADTVIVSDSQNANFVDSVASGDSLMHQIADTIPPLDSLGRAIGDTLASPDSTGKGREIGASDFANFGQDSSGNRTVDTVRHFYVLDLLDVRDRTRASYAWHLNAKTYNLEELPSFDTVMFQQHLFYPYQKTLTPVNGLGNLGAPVQSAHFFERDQEPTFLFSRNYKVYQRESLSRKHFNVRSPHTLLFYSTGGRTSQAEQMLGVMHTQNVNRFFNFGLEYNFFNTKGMYRNQLTRDNDFSAFASYYRDRLSVQFTLNTTRIQNQENGGVKDAHFIADTVMDARLVPVRLDGAAVQIKKQSASLMAGYNFVEIRKKFTDVQGRDSTIVTPIISSKLILEFERNTRKYSDREKDTAVYHDFFIYPSYTNDSVRLTTFSTTALVEINQFAKYPGIPGLRGWFTNTFGSYKFFEPRDYLFSSSPNRIGTNHLGVGVYSKSAFLNYSGALRLYLNGYRAGDKEIFGEVSVLPWKSSDLPYVKGSISISDYEPNIFVKRYFSNHYKWTTNFEKQQIYELRAEIGADRWRTWAGFNMAQLSHYVYFGSDGCPVQSSDGVAVISASLRNYLRVGWFWWLNNVIWQQTSNRDVLDLPQLSWFSSIYLQHYLVKDVLTVQLGLSAFFHTAYYADGYNPATGQFQHQRKQLVGNYPIADVFLNMKWKQAVLFFKYEHVNQGFPNTNFFVAHRYPASQRVFKYGVSWMFYN